MVVSDNERDSCWMCSGMPHLREVVGGIEVEGHRMNHKMTKRTLGVGLWNHGSHNVEPLNR